MLRRHSRLIAGVSIAVAVAVAARVLLTERTYTSSASFIPQASRPAGGVTSIAAQFGVSIPGSDNAQSPDFYIDLLTSKTILAAIIDTPFVVTTQSGTIRQTLLQRGDYGNKPLPLRRDMAIRDLRQSIHVAAAPKTGVVYVSVRSEQPLLSRDIAAALLDQVNNFNLRSRQSRASRERDFTERRLASASDELRHAEDQFEAFMQDNRNANAPRLRLQQDRLQREVVLRQQLYTTIAQAYEQAKIEAIRDTPVITIVEQPDVAALPDSRGGVMKVVLGLFGGLVLGVVIALAREALARWKVVRARPVAQPELSAQY